MSKHCCEDMDRHIKGMCDEHNNPFECPDYVICYSETFVEYGLIIHDGGPSSYDIHFCPFCGSKLPESKSEQWFEELEALGYDSPLFDDSIPEKYKSSAWWKNT